MSLLLNDKWPDARIHMEDDAVEDQRDLDRLDRYLAILETNKKACRFVPDDALMALDMAGFVRGRLNGSHPAVPISISRLALSLVQTRSGLPVQ